MPMVGDVLFSVAVKVYDRYAIMLLPEGNTGLLHISELSNHFVRNFTRYVQVGNIYRVKVLSVDESKGFIRLSAKAMSQSERHLGKTARPWPEGADSTALLKELPGWIERENA